MNIETQVCLVSVIALVISLGAVIASAPHPLVSTVNVDNVYTLQWNGNSTLLTISYQNENSTIPLDHGENFIVNGNATLYVDNHVVFKVP